MHSIDDPNFQDNRDYNYNNTTNSERQEYDIIINLIPKDVKIIDLGCGDGTLLKRIEDEKNAICKGVEISESGVSSSLQKGLDVIKHKIDEKLPFKNNTFDYSICNVTIQMVNYPEVLLNEMKRISKFQIISFPNFGFYKNRLQLLFKGKMPDSMLFGYNWYNTGHIHQLSIKDFKELIYSMKDLKIIKQEIVKPSNILKCLLMKMFPNLFQYISIFVTQRIDTTDV
ncbi:MAG: methionine biosynthesis protein MetW [Ignavibacteriales bacterium CG12_big_fil_rev_8_21_14_0_65_30_8]|nr:MAG: methionine biosynthesis protein MetW [Ignavibacteriales bacterium CG12_big_fil_rev_8_21_14_0_65_30_8]